MNQWKIAVPTMILVAIIAIWMLGKFHTEVPLIWRILIAAGGAVLSGLLTIYMSYLDRKQSSR